MILIYYSYRVAKRHKRRLHWLTVRCNRRMIRKPSNILSAFILIAQSVQMLSFAFIRDVRWPVLFDGIKADIFQPILLEFAGEWYYRSLYWAAVVWSMIFIVTM